MLKFRFKEKQNTWPAFVDLFSNLVIILIFLLIVFVFLWTTTSVFNKKSGVKVVSELRQVNKEQSETIAQMTSDEQEAKQLLILAKNELDNLSNNKQELENKVETLNNHLKETNQNMIQTVNSYESRIKDLEEENQKIKNENASLNDKVLTNIDEANKIEKEKQELLDNMSKLQQALDVKNSEVKKQQASYVELSQKLNKALADKVAELKNMSGYQSEFYKAVKLAIGDRVVVRPVGDRFIISSDILFKSGEFVLSKDGKEQLKVLSKVIKDFENKIPTSVDWIVRIDGHTDNKPVIAGNKLYKNNVELSLLRAMSVTKELIKNGVSKRRLIPSGFGSMHPLELGSDEVSLQKNRRIELRLTSK